MKNNKFICSRNQKILPVHQCGHVRAEAIGGGISGFSLDSLPVHFSGNYLHAGEKCNRSGVTPRDAITYGIPGTPGLDATPFLLESVAWRDPSVYLRRAKATTSSQRRIPWRYNIQNLPRASPSLLLLARNQSGNWITADGQLAPPEKLRRLAGVPQSLLALSLHCAYLHVPRVVLFSTRFNCDLSLLPTAFWCLTSTAPTLGKWKKFHSKLYLSMIIAVKFTLHLSMFVHRTNFRKTRYWIARFVSIFKNILVHNIVL